MQIVIEYANEHLVYANEHLVYANEPYIYMQISSNKAVYFMNSYPGKHENKNISTAML